MRKALLMAVALAGATAGVVAWKRHRDASLVAERADALGQFE